MGMNRVSSKIEVDYMYDLLEFIYWNYRWPIDADPYLRYRWDNYHTYFDGIYTAYKFNSGLYYKYCGKDINIYNYWHAEHFYTILSYVYVTPCVKTLMDALKECYNEPEDEGFINFVNKIVTEIIEKKEKQKKYWDQMTDDIKNLRIPLKVKS